MRKVISKLLDDGFKPGWSLLIGGSIVLILVTAGFVYNPGLSGPFLLDDRQNIVNNYVGEWDVGEIILVSLTNSSGPLGRPVSVFSLTLSGLIHGPEPWGYKYHNLLLHLLNALLLFWLLLRLLPELDPSVKRQRLVAVAGLVSGCWLLHPLMVSSVLYSVQRMALLSSFFTLLALLLYVLARKGLFEEKKLIWKLLLFIGVPLTILLACLSKENGALIPFYLVLIEGLVFRSDRMTFKRNYSLSAFFLLFVVAPVLLGVGYFLTHLDTLANFSTRHFTLAERLMTQLVIVLDYVKLTLLPRLSDMSLFHDDVEVVRSFDLNVAFYVALYTSVIYVLIRYRKVVPVLTFGVGWFFISHLMESTIFALELMFEHRNYLASAGLLLPLVYYAVTSLNRVLGLLIPSVLCCFLVFLTVARVQEWDSEEAIYTLAVNDHPDSFRANVELANLLFNKGRVDLANLYLAHARQIRPDQYGSSIHQFMYSCGDSRLQPRELFEEAQDRSERYPISIYSLNALNTLTQQLQLNRCAEVNYQDLESMIDGVLSLEENRSNDRYMELLKVALARVQFLQGSYDNGVSSILAAYEINENISLLIDLVQIQIQFNRLSEADDLLKRVLQTDHSIYGVRLYQEEILALQEHLSLLMDQ